MSRYDDQLSAIGERLRGGLISTTRGDPAVQVAGLRTLGTGAQQAAPGNHIHLGMGMAIPGIPGHFDTPQDLNVGSNVTLSQRINYFKNLTIQSGFTLTGLAGGTVIIVEGRLTVEGTLSVNTLGAIGGLGSKTTPTASAGGYGSGPWGRSVTTTTRTGGGFFSTGAIAANNPYDIPTRIQRHMATGGAGGNSKNGGTAATAGSAGSAWPAAAGSMFDNVNQEPVDYLLWFHAWELLVDGGGYTDSTYGSIGGGGGGGGGSASATTGTGSAGGTLGGAGVAQGAANGAGAGGGSGVGAGGGGGGGEDAAAANGGNGGRGGGVLMIICKELGGSGTISANGSAGTAGGLNAGVSGGGGGGGGGGLVVIAYDTLLTSPTLQANGGAGGAAGGANSRAGGAGGAGVATKFVIRTQGTS